MTVRRPLVVVSGAIQEMASSDTLLISKAQLGLSVTPANNFTLDASANDGTMKLARGNAGATTQDILLVDADGRLVQGLLPACIRITGANGYGSTNTAIRRYSTQALNQGNDITYVDSATLGASFTINKSGVYSITGSDGNNGGTCWIGSTLNSTKLSTSIGSITTADILGITYTPTSTAVVNHSWVGYLAAGAVIRPHALIGMSNLPNHLASFTITRVA